MEKEKRASRKQKLPISKAQQFDCKWTPTTEQWAEIAAAYGVQLDAAMRDEIIEIVNRYFRDEPIGRGAAHAADAIAWLRKMEKAALCFVWAHGTAGGGGATQYAQWILDERLKSANVPPHRVLMRMMDDYARAAFAAVAEDIKSEDHPRLDDKFAWRKMIAALWSLAFDRELPTTLNENKDASESAFVNFIIALQSTFENVRSWHMGKPDTLLAEIKKAVHGVRESKTATAAIDRET